MSDQELSLIWISHQGTSLVHAAVAPIAEGSIVDREWLELGQVSQDAVVF